MDRKYHNEFFQYTESIRIPSKCNVITFVNNGTIDVLINFFPVTAGSSFSIAGNQNEIDTTEYYIDFGTSTAGSIWVIKKINA